MKALLLFILTALPALLAPPGYGQTDGSPAMKRLGENDLPVINTQKGFSTLVEFPADQKIREVTCGDKEFWVVEGSGRFLHIKPGKENIETNLNVIVEGDIVYAFILREVTRTGFNVPKADLQVTVNPGEDPAKLRASLDAALQQNAAMKETLAKRDQDLAAWNAKYQADHGSGQGLVTPSTAETPKPCTAVPHRIYRPSEVPQYFDQISGCANQPRR